MSRFYSRKLLIRAAIAVVLWCDDSPPPCPAVYFPPVLLSTCELGSAVGRASVESPGSGCSLHVFWSRKTGSAVPFRVSLLVFHTRAGSGAYSRDSSQFPRRRPCTYAANRHRISPEFIRSRDCVPMAFHCRESAATGPVVLTVVPVTGAAFSGFTMDQLVCASPFPHPLLLV